MHTSLEQLLATSDLSDDQKELLREEISHATEQQQMLWYVLLRGMDRSDVRALCDVFALKKSARDGKISLTQMIDRQEELLLNMARKEDVRNQLKQSDEER